MKYSAKANTGKKYRRNNELIIGFVGLLSCFGFVMLIYEFVAGNLFFGISYSIATFLGFTYVIIRMNTVFATYVAAEDGVVYMKNWSNDFLPYNPNCKIKLISEFVPAKTKVLEIPIEEISKIAIGTKNFIKRSAGENSEFLKKIKKVEMARDYYRKKTISAMDLLYAETADGACAYMPIDKFEKSDVIKVIRYILKSKPEIELNIGSREYRSLKAKSI